MEADINLDEIDHLGTTKSILRHFVLETIFLIAFFSTIWTDRHLYARFSATTFLQENGSTAFFAGQDHN